MGFFRWVFGLPVAAAITVGLFLMMSALIKSEREPGADAPPPVIDFLVKPQPPARTPAKPPKLNPNDEPPPPDFERPRPGKPDGGDFRPEPKPIDPLEITGTGKRGTTIQVAPPYPAACRSKGVEGVVIVQFDITDRGETTNVQVISSPDRCFDRDVIRAVRGWRFPAEARRGVTEAIRFQFEE